jgi:Undecaprenyl-phosphate glucose phosphotransferase
LPTRRTLNLLELCLSVTYFVIPFAAFTAAKYVRFATNYFPPADADSSSYLLWVVVVTSVWALVFEKCRLNRAETIMGFNTGVWAMARAVFYTMTIAFALFFFYRQTTFSRVFAVTGCALTFVLSLLTLHVFRAVLRSRRGPFRVPLRLAILGVEGYETRLANHLELSAVVPVKVACVIPLEAAGSAESKWPILHYSRVEEVVDHYHCQEVLVALPPSRLGDLQKLLQPLTRLCVPVRVALDMGEGVFVPERIFNFHGLPFLDIRTYPVDTMSYVVGKRIFDIIFSAAALVFAAPLLALIGMLIKLTSTGPILFSQERLGLNGRRFKMLKFRTMYVQQSRSSNTQHTSRNDPRITPLGRLLRRTSLDEFPQFFNVLKGDMSVVGPRPELTFFAHKFRQEIPSYMARHNVKCGITGLAQISGFRGSDTSISERIEQDLRYLQNWSLGFDLRIIAMTVILGLINRNAY